MRYRIRHTVILECWLKMTKLIIYERAGELFCGPGGSGIGSSMIEFETVDRVIKIRHVWASDYDKDSCQTYEQNFAQYEAENLGINEQVKVIHGDVNDPNIDVQNKEQFEEIDGLIFGFPCNDFSLVGESKGLNGKFGPLYKHGIRILNRDDKPKWSLAENVSGLSSSNDGRAFKQIITEMIEAGYTVTAHKYKFEDYGIPQSRHRIIIVGFRNDLNIDFKVPAPSNKTMTASQALSDIPDDATHQELTRQSQQVVERLKHIKPGQNVWNAELPDRARTFTMITDDNQAFDMAVQQDSRKAISTANNSELGKYFRKRLGVKDGELITKKHLITYGRTDYTIEKIDEETFILDFSV